MELAPVIRARYLDANGSPLAGGKLYTYEANSSTPKATYSNRSGTANTNPIILDANGECSLWLDSGYYKIVLKDSSDVTQWTQDYVSLASEAALASAFYRDVVYYTSADSPVTIVQTHNGKLLAFDTSSGAIVVNLPQISAMNLPFNIALSLKTAGNNLTINRSGTDTINGSTSKVITATGVGCHLIADIDKSPDQWEVVDLGTVSDGAITAAKLNSAVISGLTEDTSPDPVADYMHTYDGSAATNKKILFSRAKDFGSVSKTANYTATIADDLIKCSGSAFTVTLYAASGNAGKTITFIKTDSSTSNVITIDANSTETINGSLTTSLNTQYERLTLLCDGSNWLILERYIPATWISANSVAAGTLITGESSNPTYGTTSNNTCKWRRVGSNAEIEWDYYHTAAGSNGSGIYYFNIPSEIGTIDTGFKTTNSNTTYTNYAKMQSSVGFMSQAESGGYFLNGPAIVHTSSKVKFHLGYTGPGQGASIWSGSGGIGWNSTEFAIVMHMSVPISGWAG